MTFALEYFDLNTTLGIAAYSFCVVILCWVLSRVSRTLVIFLLRKRLTKEKFGVTRLKFTRNSLRFIYGLLGFLIIMFTVPVFRQQAGYIFSGAGILAAIIGFAAKDAISNLIGGLFIVLFRPFRVGDYIKLNDSREGIIDDITLRHTIITTFENKRLIIPNSVISTESVLNVTIHETKILSFNEFYIGVYADIDKAKSIIISEASKLDYVIDNRTLDDIVNNEPEFDVRIINISESAITIRAYIWVSDPLKEFRMKGYFKEAVHKRFIEEGVELPIPLRKIIS
ncbi:MAG: mechanosensitive ion channel family protein [Flavobacteriaceae bacterium]